MGTRSDERDVRKSNGSEDPAPYNPLEQLRALLGRRLAHITEDHIRSVLSVRRGREALFGRHLFSDPAWDIILELYAARSASRRMSASELARAVDIPTSVITRWLASLIESGLVASDANENEGAAASFALTDDAAAKLTQLADKWISAFLAI